ncbi:MAG TPA: AAA family ATPase [Solirubrobacteraceae bacterium]|nr:AAA family ATPase [Solirubrobacteraceae bacterium]
MNLVRQASGDLFPTDVPIPASQMIGRADDIRDVTAALLGATNLVMAGPRRTGKTSVCEAALTRCRRRGCYVTRLDLFRIADAGELAEALALGVIANRSASHRIIRRARELGRAALSATQASAMLKLQRELGDAIEFAITPGGAAQDPARALDLALALPERVAVADGRRLVLFFDEFQELASERRPYGDPDAVTNRMRAIFQRSTSVSHLFAGSLEHVMRDLFAPQQRAFSGFGSFHTLRPIPAEDWRTGLRERFAADECTIGDAALDRLVSLGEGHPRATMRIAQQTHLVSVQLAQRMIDLDIVELGHQAALNGDRPTMEQTVETIRRLHKNALLVARTVALGQPLPRRLAPAIRDRTLKRLEHAGLLEHPARGEWRIVNPLLAEYLRQLDPYT